MRHALPLFLEEDTLEHIDWIARRLSEERNATVSRSEAVSWLVNWHWKKVMKKLALARRQGRSVPDHR